MQAGSGPVTRSRAVALLSLAAVFALSVEAIPARQAAAPKAPVKIRLVFDTTAAAPHAAAPGNPATADSSAPPAQAPPSPAQPGDLKKATGMWNAGAGALDPRVMAAVRIPSESSALIATAVFHVELTLLDAVERRRLVAEATGQPPESLDVFDALAFRGTPYLVLLAEIFNDAGEPLSFNPQNILLVTDHPDHVAPLDATRAWEAMREAGLPADELLPRVQKVIYDTASMLPAGKSVSRLLAYRLPKAWFHRARVDFSFFSVGPASFSFQVPMRPIPVEDDAQAGDAAPAGAD